jgi:hypothetical protein
MELAIAVADGKVLVVYCMSGIFKAEFALFVLFVVAAAAADGGGGILVGFSRFADAVVVPNDRPILAATASSVLT